MNKNELYGWLSSLVKTTSLSLILLCGTPTTYTPAFADGGTYALSPPVSSTEAPANDNSSSAVDPNSTVFNWKEVPSKQEVPLTRAVFDKSGYELFDTVGETILVPFIDSNLFVMKFAVSTTGSMYFVNTGDDPVLYVPSGGYLENGSVPGAKWYPFNNDFQPANPVYMGVMPNWSDYSDTGWYSDETCTGGYWCATPFGLFEPSAGLSITLGANSFTGWSAYNNFLESYPAPYSMGFYGAVGHFHHEFRGGGDRIGYGGGQYGWQRPPTHAYGGRPYSAGYGSYYSQGYTREYRISSFNGEGYRGGGFSPRAGGGNNFGSRGAGFGGSGFRGSGRRR